MKVLDLGCPDGHVFEGWFASEDDFQNQKGRHLVQCPLCGSAAVEKRLSAPRLNLGARGADAQVAPDVPDVRTDGAVTAPAQVQAAWLQRMRKVLAETEDVGARFAQEARRIHQGEADERAIRGQATAQETLQLLEEGIPVFPLAIPDASKETLQ